jgi:hypothetical protein
LSETIATCTVIVTGTEERIECANDSEMCRVFYEKGYCLAGFVYELLKQHGSLDQAGRHVTLSSFAPKTQASSSSSFSSLQKTIWCMSEEQNRRLRQYLTEKQAKLGERIVMLMQQEDPEKEAAESVALLGYDAYAAVAAMAAQRRQKRGTKVGWGTPTISLTKMIQDVDAFVALAVAGVCCVRGTTTTTTTTTTTITNDDLYNPECNHLYGDSTSTDESSDDSQTAPEARWQKSPRNKSTEAWVLWRVASDALQLQMQQKSPPRTDLIVCEDEVLRLWRAYEALLTANSNCDSDPELDDSGSEQVTGWHQFGLGYSNSYPRGPPTTNTTNTTNTTTITAITTTTASSSSSSSSSSSCSSSSYRVQLEAIANIAAPNNYNSRTTFFPSTPLTTTTTTTTASSSSSDAITVDNPPTAATTAKAKNAKAAKRQRYKDRRALKEVDSARHKKMVNDGAASFDHPGPEGFVWRRSSESKCASCGVFPGIGDKLKKCVRCYISRVNAVRYCSTDCQRAHWKSHRAVCKRHHWFKKEGGRITSCEEVD